MAKIEKYQLKNGEIRYSFQIHAGRNPLTGKRQVTRRRGFRTRAQARVELNRLKAKVDRDGSLTPTKATEKLTVSDVYDLWLISYKNQVKPQTFYGVEEWWKNRVKPELGDVLIKKLSPAIALKFVDKLANATDLKNYKPAVSIIRRVCDFAVTQEMIKTNPFRSVKLPPSQNTKKGDTQESNLKKNVLTKDQLDDYLRVFKNEKSFQVYAFFYLLSRTGMRKSEALALTWTDIDTDVIHIRRTLVYHNYHSEMGDTTKTQESKRDIKINGDTQRLLSRLHLYTNRKCVENNIEDREYLVFPSLSHLSKNGLHAMSWPMQVLTRTQHDHPDLKKVTVHGFRHTFATLAISAGLSLRDVQHILGHRHYYTTTDFYAAYTNSERKDAYQKLDQFFASDSKN